jgi:hypothetical protein
VPRDDRVMATNGHRRSPRRIAANIAKLPGLVKRLAGKVLKTETNTAWVAHRSLPFCGYSVDVRWMFLSQIKGIEECGGSPKRPAKMEGWHPGH